MPRLGSRHKGQGAIVADLTGKIPGTPQPAVGIVTALRLDLEEALPPRAAISGERRAFAAFDGQAQRRQIGPGGDLVSLSSRGERVLGCERLADRRLEGAEVYEGSKAQACLMSAAEQAKGDVHDIVAGWHHDRF